LLDLAFPIFEELKKHMIKSPSFSYYVLQAFKNWTWVTIFLRIVDAFTDITLTKTYFEDFDSVVNDFIGNTLSFQPGNSSCLDIACVKKQCVDSEVWKHKLICTFPLMQWWISGTLSVVVLAITYLAEVLSTMVSDKFNHYFELYSGVCCEKHHKWKIIARGLILPLGQQMSTLIYGHWIKCFTGYWQDKNTDMIESSSLPSNNSECIKHCDENKGQ
jgi:hypothetical protein